MFGGPQCCCPSYLPGALLLFKTSSKQSHLRYASTRAFSRPTILNLGCLNDYLHHHCTIQLRHEFPSPPLPCSSEQASAIGITGIPSILMGLGVGVDVFIATLAKYVGRPGPFRTHVSFPLLGIAFHLPPCRSGHPRSFLVLSWCSFLSTK
jgi:hypothetical protein